MMKKYVIVCGIMLFLAGCATTESIDDFYTKINWKDGISRDEAAVIAKKYLVDSKYEGDFQVMGPVAIGFDHYWRVSFLYKSLDYYEKTLDIDVDTLSGEVKKVKIRDRKTPPVVKDLMNNFNNSDPAVKNP